MAAHSKSLRFGTASYKNSSRTKKLRLLGGQKRVGPRRRTDGHKKFRRSVWHCKSAVGTAEFIAEEKRVGGLWSEMPPEEKALWEAEGAAEDAVLFNMPNFIIHTLDAHSIWVDLAISSTMCNHSRITVKAFTFLLFELIL